MQHTITLDTTKQVWCLISRVCWGKGAISRNDEKQACWSKTDLCYYIPIPHFDFDISKQCACPNNKVPLSPLSDGYGRYNAWKSASMLKSWIYLSKWQLDDGNSKCRVWNLLNNKPLISRYIAKLWRSLSLAARMIPMYLLLWLKS